MNTLTIKEAELVDKVIKGKPVPADKWRETVKAMNYKMTVVDWSTNDKCRKMAMSTKDLTREEVR